MRTSLSITKALSDETRVRALLALREDELCVCHLIELLDLAPSTVSKHLEILHQAQLIERRKAGRWHYYRLAGEDAPDVVRQALQWVLNSLVHETVIVGDADRLCGIREKTSQELTRCYRTPVAS